MHRTLAVLAAPILALAVNASAGLDIASAKARDGVVVTTQETRFGRILFDGDGQAIYLFDKEKTSRPECYDACAQAWPPVLARGAPRARGHVKEALLGTTKRTDGTAQVTYAGHPLYYYAHEGKNVVECHRVRGFGGLWLAVAPSGRAAD